MDLQIMNSLRAWVRQNKYNRHKINLIEYLQDKICRYSNQEATPSEQIKGMNRLLRDIILIYDERFEMREPE